MQKRALAIHDLSCFGRCSLTVALPVLSAAGIEATVLPTVVLSTHTGGIAHYTVRDLTEDMRPIARHWQSLGLAFDALYTGYLGTLEQIEIVEELIGQFGGGALVLVDPVMADNGRLYPQFGPGYPAGMARLCGAADVIVPNMTEAALLLGRAYQAGPYALPAVRDMARALAALGPKKVCLTGVHVGRTDRGAAVYDAGRDDFAYVEGERIEGDYHGTGDVFASALLAGLLAGCGMAEAAAVAVDFTVGAIRRSKDEGTDRRFGVNFEAGLYALAGRLREGPHPSPED